MPTKYDDTGAVVDWDVKAGDPITKTWLVTDPDTGTAVDVSGATITAVVVADSDATTPVVTFTCSKPAVADDNAVKLLYADGIDTVGSYWWAVKVLMADGETVYRGEGPFTVEPNLGL